MVVFWGARFASNLQRFSDIIQKEQLRSCTITTSDALGCYLSADPIALLRASVEPFADLGHPTSTRTPPKVGVIARRQDCGSLSFGIFGAASNDLKNTVSSIDQLGSSKFGEIFETKFLSRKKNWPKEGTQIFDQQKIRRKKGTKDIKLTQNDPEKSVMPAYGHTPSWDCASSGNRGNVSHPRLNMS